MEAGSVLCYIYLKMSVPERKKEVEEICVMVKNVVTKGPKYVI
jgi:hypothetical protein